MLYSVIANIIEDEFRNEFIKKDKCFTNEAMLLRFELYHDRNLDLLIHGPSRYIAVYTRETFKDGIIEPWRVWCYHDSCWTTDGVERVMKTYARDIYFLPTVLHGWWSLKTLSQAEMNELKEVRKLRY